MTTIKRRPMVKLHSPGDPLWAQLGDPDGFELSLLLELADQEPLQERIFLCGKLAEMSREYMREPLDEGWKISGEFAFKHRVAVYHRPETPGREISVRLISHRESWLPGCESMLTAIPAWRALESEWAATGLPLLSSPAATGKALLWETLPCDREGNPIEFPSLSNDLARLIRANSPQHRLEVMQRYPVDMNAEPFTIEPQNCIQYDGRWMYASLCGLDRFSIGEPKRAGGFVPYAPGVYDVTVRIPEIWNHIGLIPMREGASNWWYPHEGGYSFRTWAFEPELTFALKNKIAPWEIVEVHDGYSFDKGRPFLNWSNKLIEIRHRLQNDLPERGQSYKHREFAAAAIRQILNHTIGSIHKNEYQRETFISKDNFKLWRRENPFQAEGDDVVEIKGGYLVPCFVPDTSRLSIFMPHWSATLYSLARARVAEWALRCDPSTLVKIHGDAIYSTIEQPKLDELDAQRLGQPRRKP